MAEETPKRIDGFSWVIRYRMVWDLLHPLVLEYDIYASCQAVIVHTVCTIGSPGCQVQTVRNVQH